MGQTERQTDGRTDRSVAECPPGLWHNNTPVRCRWPAVESVLLEMLPVAAPHLPSSSLHSAISPQPNAAAAAERSDADVVGQVHLRRSRTRPPSAGTGRDHRQGALDLASLQPADDAATLAAAAGYADVVLGPTGDVM